MWCVIRPTRPNWLVVDSATTHVYVYTEIGYVAFVVNPSGGDVLSPSGSFRRRLPPLPAGNVKPTVAFIRGKILSCGGFENINCYLYNIHSNTWSVYSASVFHHDLQPGVVYRNRIYLLDDQHPEVFDPDNKKWSRWPQPSIETGGLGCIVAWRDQFFLFGGFHNRNGIQTFDHATSAWSQLSDDQPAPIDIFESGCVQIPGRDEILVTGFDDHLETVAAALYDIKTNSWQLLPTPAVPYNASSLVALGSRVFLFSSDVLREFHYSNSSWSQKNVDISYCEYPEVISVPAEVFQDLPGGCVGVK